MQNQKILSLLIQHWSKLLLGFLAVASFAVWGERFFTANRIQSNQDFLIANQVLERFVSGEPLAVESIEATERILKSHPELHPKYDTMLAMTYLSQHNPSKALPFAKATLSSVEKELSPYVQSYAKTSFLIAQKRYDEAYKEAQNLYLQMDENKINSTLFAMNLLRLVSLEMEVDTESDHFEELKAHRIYPLIASIFKEGNLSLEDWHSLRLNN